MKNRIVTCEMLWYQFKIWSDDFDFYVKRSPIRRLPLAPADMIRNTRGKSVLMDQQRIEMELNQGKTSTTTNNT